MVADDLQEISCCPKSLCIPVCSVLHTKNVPHSDIHDVRLSHLYVVTHKASLACSATAKQASCWPRSKGAFSSHLKADCLMSSYTTWQTSLQMHHSKWAEEQDKTVHVGCASSAASPGKLVHVSFAAENLAFVMLNCQNYCRLS